MARVTASKTLKKSKKALRQKLQDEKCQAGQKKKKISSKVKAKSKEDLAGSESPLTDEALNLLDVAEESSFSESEELISEKREHIAKKSKFLKKEIKEEESDHTVNKEKILSIVSPKKGSENSKLDVDVATGKTNQSPTKLKNESKFTPVKTLTKDEKAKMFRKLVIKDGIISTVYEPKLTREELKKQYEDKVNTKLIKESSTTLASTNGLSKLNQGEAETSPDASEESEGDDDQNLSVDSEDELDADVTYSPDAFKDEAQSLSNIDESGSDSEEIMSEKREHSPEKAKFFKKEIEAEKSGNTFNEENIGVVSPKTGSENSKLFDVDVSPEKTSQSPTKLKDESKFAPVKTLTKAEKAKMFRKLVIKDGIISTVYEPRLTREELQKQYEDKFNRKLIKESSTILASSSGLSKCNQDEAETSPGVSEESKGDDNVQNQSVASEDELDADLTQNSPDASDKSEENEAQSCSNSHQKNSKKRSNTGDAQCSEDDKEPQRKKQKVLEKQVEILPLQAKKLENGPELNIGGSETKPNIEEIQNDSKSVYVKNLPFNISDETLSSHFAAFGPIASACVVNMKRCSGYVKFQSETSSEKAIRSEKMEINGKQVLILPCKSIKSMEKILTKITELKNRRITGGITITNPTSEKSVKVINLPHDVKEHALCVRFSHSFGTVESARVVQTGVGEAIGFVNFKSENSKEEAIRSAKLVVYGKQVRILPYTSTSDSFLAKKLANPKKFSPKKEDGLLNEQKSIEKTIKKRRNSL